MLAYTAQTHTFKKKIQNTYLRISSFGRMSCFNCIVKLKSQNLKDNTLGCFNRPPKLVQ